MQILNASQQQWLESHPYLRQIARLQEVVTQAVESAALPALPFPNWEAYAADYAAGVPLLISSSAAIEVSQRAAKPLTEIVARLADAALPQPLRNSCAQLRDEFARSPQQCIRAVDSVVRGTPTEQPSGDAGLRQFLVWSVLKPLLAPLREAFQQWRSEETWRREFCPTCGSLPMMAQLVPSSQGVRERLLACGCCETRWKYKRIGCPFCGNEDSDLLEILTVEDDQKLRIDACRQCRGYLKTYIEVGQEELLLADWSTLHLDALAQERGLERRGKSLYQL